MSYFVALLTVVVLCGGWAAFQFWMSRRDPDVAARLNKCGNCGCAGKSECERSQG